MPGWHRYPCDFKRIVNRLRLSIQHGYWGPGGWLRRFPQHDFIATLRAIADHWHEVRGGRPMPSWSQIRPSSIAPYLTWIWSFRYDRDKDEFTARLAGNHITMGFGKNFRGTRLEDIHRPPALGRVETGLRRLLLTPSLYRSTGKLFRQGDHTEEGERIALPLAADGIHGDGVLAHRTMAPYRHPSRASPSRCCKISRNGSPWTVRCPWHLPAPWPRPWLRS